MGGQEALLVAGRFPERIAAVCVFNPIVDLAAWQIDLARTEIEKFQEIDLAGMIALEVGGLPAGSARRVCPPQRRELYRRAGARPHHDILV